MKVFLVRHGETTWNKLGKIQGHTDISLSEHGFDQAEALRESDAFKKIHFADRVYCSDLLRARQTAEVLCKAVPAHQLIPTPAIREKFFGKFEGMPTAELIQAYMELSKLPEEVKWVTAAADEESHLDALERALSFLESILPLPYSESSSSLDGGADETTLVVTHFGIVRVLYLYIMKDLSMDQLIGWENLGFLHIEIGKDRHDIRILEAKGVKLAN